MSFIVKTQPHNKRQAALLSNYGKFQRETKNLIGRLNYLLSFKHDCQTSEGEVYTACTAADEKLNNHEAPKLAIARKCCERK